MGIFNKILGSILKSKTETVVNLIQHDKNLAEATKKLEKSSAEWKKALKKSAKLQEKLDGDGGALLNKLRGK